jgi:hypothetical protein
MLERVHEAYDSHAKAEKAMSFYPVGDRDCHLSIGQLGEAEAMMMYRKPEIWILSGEWYK